MFKYNFKGYSVNPCYFLCDIVITFFFFSFPPLTQAPNPAATEFIPKGAPRMSTMSQAAVPTFPSPLFPHPGLSGSAAAGLAPGEYLFSVGSFLVYVIYREPSLTLLFRRYVFVCWVVSSALAQNHSPYVTRPPAP